MARQPAHQPRRRLRWLIAVGQARAGLLAAPIAMGAAALGAWVVVASGDPDRMTLLPCPLLSLTGIACPLCGGTRAAHALAHGEVLDAAGYNLLLLPTVPVAAALWVRWVVRRARGERMPFVALSPRLLTVGAVVLLAFAIIRNLPAGGWLFP